jgi:hypothetical protein
MSKISFIAKIEQFDSNLWGYHFMVPDNMANIFIEGDNRRVICTIAQSHKINSALMPSKLGYFILVNAEIRKKFNLHIGSEVSIELEKDRSEFGMPMPDEFREVLEQDELGSKFFYALTPGKQRTLLYMIGKVKNTDSKIRKSLAVMQHLCLNKGVLDFKLLNETMKEFNKNK